MPLWPRRRRAERGRRPARHKSGKRVPHRRRPLHGNVSTASSSRSVHRPERCRVRELPDCTHDPTPDRHARSITVLPELLRHKEGQAAPEPGSGLARARFGFSQSRFETGQEPNITLLPNAGRDATRSRHNPEAVATCSQALADIVSRYDLPAWWAGWVTFLQGWPKWSDGAGESSTEQAPVTPQT